MSVTHSNWKHFFLGQPRVTLLFIIAITLGVFVLGSIFTKEDGFVSSELRFFERSASGLHIVPASCPSNPHYSGECEAPPQPVSGCVIQASRTSIVRGQTSLISWNSEPDAYGSFGLNGTNTLSPGGSVPTAGSWTVLPTDTTTYTLTITRYTGNLDMNWQMETVTKTCSVTVSVDSTIPLVVGYPVGNPGQCVAGSPHTITMSYAGGADSEVYYMIDWGDGSPQVRSPATGYVAASTYHTAQRTYSSGGQKTVSVKAVTATGTETGWGHYTFTCSGACIEENYCGGVDITGDGIGDTRRHRYPSPNQCIDDVLEQCPWGCVSSVCLPAPEASADIRVTPALVRSGNQTLVEWDAEDVTSCTVNEDNSEIDDSWSGAEMGCGGGSCSSSHQSSEITRRTKYTLTCTGLDGQTYTDTATVNIVPVWIEN